MHLFNNPTYILDHSSENNLFKCSVKMPVIGFEPPPSSVVNLIKALWSEPLAYFWSLRL